MSTEQTSQILTALLSQSLPPPSQAWLQSLLSSRPRPLPPLPSLIATAKARLLAADLASPDLLDASYATAANFASAGGGGVGGAGAGDTSNNNNNVPTAHVKEAKLSRDIVVQVLDIENLSRSRWDQVEELEAVARGELTRGREIIRLPTTPADDEGEGEDGSSSSGAGSSGGNRGPAGGGAAPGTTAASGGGASDRNATHRFVLQDCKGRKLFGLELRRVERLGVGRTGIGEKLLLRTGTVVARGTVLLEPERCVVLGGKVEAWNRAWLDGRLARLKAEAGVSDRR